MAAAGLELILLYTILAHPSRNIALFPVQELTFRQKYAGSEKTPHCQDNSEVFFH